MASISIAGPQFGGKIIRTHVDPPQRPGSRQRGSFPNTRRDARKLSIRRMSTSDLKVLQAILSEELRIVRVRMGGRPRTQPSLGSILDSIRRNVLGWDATDRELRAMEARLAEIEGEITQRNLRDLQNGRTGWTSPRQHPRSHFAVSLAEAAKVH